MILASSTWIFPTPVQAKTKTASLPEAQVEIKQVYGPVPTSHPNIPTDKAAPAPKKKIPVPKAPASGRNHVEASGEIQIMMKAKVATKWGEEYWPAMRYILDHESGSNPYAVNKSSGACGLFQALPCSKLLNVIGSLDNISGQMDWGISYIAARYGNPIIAMQHHQAHNWY